MLYSPWRLRLLLAAAACGIVSWPVVARADDLMSAPGAAPGEPGSVSLGLEYDGSSSIHTPTALGLFSAGYDFTPRFSLGVDLLLSKGTRRTNVLSPNASYMFLTSSHGLHARAGYANVGVRSFGEQPFVSFAQSMRQTDIIAGWTRDSGHDRLILGLEGKLSEQWSGVVDWITGSGNFAAAGARYHLSESRAATLAYLHANARSDGDGIYLAYAFSFKAGGRTRMGNGGR
jgi:hypothetical protein